MDTDPHTYNSPPGMADQVEIIVRARRQAAENYLADDAKLAKLEDAARAKAMEPIWLDITDSCQLVSAPSKSDPGMKYVLVLYNGRCIGCADEDGGWITKELDIRIDKGRARSSFRFLKLQEIR